MKAPARPSLSPETKERIKHGFYIIHNRQLHLKDIKVMRLADARRYIDIALRAESLAQPIEGIGQKRRLGQLAKLGIACIILLIVAALVVGTGVYKELLPDSRSDQSELPLE